MGGALPGRAAGQGSSWCVRTRCIVIYNAAPFNLKFKLVIKHDWDMKLSGIETQF